MDFHLILDADGMGTPARTHFRNTASHSTSKRRNARTIKYIPDLPQQSRQANNGSTSSRRRVRVPTSNRLGSLASSAHPGIVTVYPTRSKPHTYVAAQGSVKQHPSSGWKSDIKNHDRNVSSCRPSHSVSSATSSSSSSRAVSKVREDMVRESVRRGRLGTRRTIMDFVLDSKSPSVDYSEEFLREMAIRCRVLSPFRHEYAFVIGCEHTLQDYWDEQSRIWVGVDDIQSSVGFPDSYERGVLGTTTKTQHRQDRDGHRELSEVLIRRLSALARDLNL